MTLFGKIFLDYALIQLWNKHKVDYFFARYHGIFTELG